MADVYACPVATVANKEGPALGAAILAGVGAGIYASVAEGCKAVLQVRAPQHPILENAQAYAPFYELYQQIYPALKSGYAALAKL